jgi:ketosteroid isomerase-like protein
MTSRTDIERIIKDAYQARKAGDLAAMRRIFTPDLRFKLAGSPAASAVAVDVAGMENFQAVVGGMIKTFDWVDQTILSMVVEGQKAAVHWRGHLRSTVTGDVVETEMVDLFEIRDAQISSLVEFCDTALAARMMAAPLR